MSAKHIGLGRGLGALIKESPPPSEAAVQPTEQVLTVPVDQIVKNPWQPRHHFSDQALEDLVRSVRDRGVLQPLLVRQVKRDEGPRFELIAGERRFRAAQQAGVSDVPAIVMDVTDIEALELALIENLQREDLNVIEEAEGYAALAEKFQLTQENIAQRVGKARATVANCLRLLTLPASVRDALASGQLSAGHAKVLLGVDAPEEQEKLARQVIRNGLSVRALEALLGQETAPRKKKPRAEKLDIPREHLGFVTELLQRHFSTSVRVTPCKTLANGKKAKGAVEIDFYSSEELDHLLDVLGLADQL